MSSLRSITVVPAGVDPFARLRTVTNPATGETTEAALLTGPVTITVPVGPPGRRGEQGDHGEGAAAAAHIERTFANASTTWEWDHGLGYAPGVQLMLPDRSVLNGAITYNGPDLTRAEFYVPVAGIMALS